MTFFILMPSPRPSWPIVGVFLLCGFLLFDVYCFLKASLVCHICEQEVIFSSKLFFSNKTLLFNTFL